MREALLPRRQPLEAQDDLFDSPLRWNGILIRHRATSFPPIPARHIDRRRGARRLVDRSPYTAKRSGPNNPCCGRGDYAPGLRARMKSMMRLMARIASEESGADRTRS